MVCPITGAPSYVVKKEQVNERWNVGEWQALYGSALQSRGVGRDRRSCRGCDGWSFGRSGRYGWSRCWLGDRALNREALNLNFSAGIDRHKSCDGLGIEAF